MDKLYDLVIIGAGPGGLAAAVTACGLGLSAVVVDEQPEPGGQIYRSIERSRPEHAATLGKDYFAGKPLVDAFRASGATYVPNATVWNIERGFDVDIQVDNQLQRIHGKRLLFCIGAIERPVPVSHWTLPGVMGAAASDILFKSADMIPQGPVVLAGSGPLLLLVACHLIDNGVEVAALAETSSMLDAIKAMPHVPGALRKSSYLFKGLQMKRKIMRSGLPMYASCRDLAVVGDKHAEGVRFSCRGKTHEVAAATVLLHEGVVPNLRLTQLLDCEHEWYAPQRYWRPVLDQWGRSSAAGVYVAGDAGGINGGVVAELTGHLAAIDTAFRLGTFTDTERDRLARPHLQKVKQELSIRPFLNHVFPPNPQALVPPDDDTIVCRCEELTAGQIREAVSQGARHPAQVKSRTRAGMGPCQGRMCATTVAEIIAQSASIDIATIGALRVRPPLQPLTIEQYANLDV